jgi:hypothetical protein
MDGTAQDEMDAARVWRGAAQYRMGHCVGWEECCVGIGQDDVIE